jgi:hypothetical protein
MSFVGIVFFLALLQELPIVNVIIFYWQSSLQYFSDVTDLFRENKQHLSLLEKCCHIYQ